MSTVARSQTVDIGGGRGRLTPRAAASLRRVDRALGRPLDVNSAWRDPAVQQRLRDAYIRYLNGGPWAPIALDPDDSVHCDGEAVDSDDGYNTAAVSLLAEHGWRRTVYRKVNGVWKLIEPWHFEYFHARDKHRFDPAPAGLAQTPVPAAPEPDEPEEDTMKMLGYIGPDGRTWYAQYDTSSGFWSEFVSDDKDYIREVAAKWAPNGIPLVSKKHRDDLKAECDRISGRTASASA